MTKIASLSVLLSAVVLSGCIDINFMNIRAPGSKEITLADVEKVKPGMNEGEVISLLGPPISFGIDDEGRDYLHYETAKISLVDQSTLVPFFGIASRTAETKGFTFNVYLQSGLVRGTSQYFYQAGADEKKPAKDQPVK